VPVKVHEMSLAEGVLQIVEEAIEKAARAGDEPGFVKVKRVFVEIGQLSSVEPDALRFCFEAVASGTLAEGATLEVIEVPGEGLCFNCSQTVHLAALYDPCPACGGYPVQATGGTQMRVKELEVE
jgi:hydrogenase nickel incorporation protein HypA/HybF